LSALSRLGQLPEDVAQSTPAGSHLARLLGTMRRAGDHGIEKDFGIEHEENVSEG